MNLQTPLLAAAIVLCACDGLDGQPEPIAPVAGTSLPAGAGWDESLAAAARPCGDPQPGACEAATSGACGVVDLPVGPLCLPRFNWGVRGDDGAIEFASSQRLFTIEDLADSPLSKAELAEGRALFDELAAGDLAGAPPEARIISHTGMCSTSYVSCYAGTPYGRSSTYYYHLNVPLSGGRTMHRHILKNWDAYYLGPGRCNRFRWTGTTAVYCGTTP